MQNDQLVLDYIPLAKKIARQTSLKTPPSVTEEEILSAAYMGLVSAARRFDSGKGKFAPYARLRISGEINDYLRSRRGPEVSEIEFEVTQDYEDEVLTRDFFDFLATRLSESEDEVLRMYYLEGRTLKDIGDRRGVGESRVSQILSGSLKKLKKPLKGLI